MQLSRIGVWVWLVCVAGCLHESAVVCRDGSVCPAGFQCVESGAGTAGQLCAAGACGNGRMDPGEACDDGNNRSGDGCPADCTAACGDGVRDPGEACDDGNTDDGDGCAADCQSLDSIFEISPSTVSFTVAEGDPAPAVEVTLRLELRNDDVLVGYAPGVTPPPWLAITDLVNSPTTATFTLRITDTSLVGDHATSLRLTVSHENSTGLQTFDLPVSYRVTASDLAGQAAPGTLAFSAITGATAVPTQQLAVTFNGERVALTGRPAWLTVASPLDLATSPATFGVAVNNTAFAPGTALSDALVFVTTRGAIQRTVRVPVSLNVLGLPALSITAGAPALSFIAIAGGTVPVAQQLGVTFNGDDVSVSAMPPWLSVVSPADPTLSPATFAVTTNTTAITVGTVLTGNLVLATSRGGRQQTATVHLSYQVLREPELQLVAPHVGIAGRPGVLYAHGRGLQVGGPVTVTLGDVTLAPVVPDSDNQLTLHYPALPAGHYPVRLLVPAGIAPSQPELVIAGPSTFAYQALAVPAALDRLIYDAGRQALYGVNVADHQIEHFAVSQGAWVAQPHHAVSQLTDMILAPGGQSLLAIARGAIDEISLTDGAFTPIERAHLGADFCNFFIHLAAANNGKVWLQTSLNGSGSCSAYFYDLLDHTLVSSGGFYNGVSTATGDGTRIYARSSDLHEAVQIYDARSNTISGVLAEGFGFYTMSISDNGSRVIADGSTVYNGALQLTGNLPYTSSYDTLASHDSTRAFVYVQDAAGARLDIYDLNGPLQAGAQYPLLATIPLADAANSAAHYTVAMTSTPDDRVVFIAGDRKLLIVPVSQMVDHDAKSR